MTKVYFTVPAAQRMETLKGTVEETQAGDGYKVYFASDAEATAKAEEWDRLRKSSTSGPQQVLDSLKSSFRHIGTHEFAVAHRSGHSMDVMVFHYQLDDLSLAVWIKEMFVADWSVLFEENPRGGPGGYRMLTRPGADNDPNADIYFLDNQTVSPMVQGGWGKVVWIWKVGEPNNLCAKVVPKSFLKSGGLVKHLNTEFNTQVKVRSSLAVKMKEMIETDNY
uniref:Uncharacterized protein n=1 Tax=Chromera velia CCMP2878 TaxID=1169474 RepID=A0A0G4HH59_9ALVE|eukprot:Cvel_6784.t1-p1 / transcript=Cvel_6784.t1 / gene=Cvel_6784 / organism=Chromera_velia_CCMP2878 / gene_product=hypothetical protein / transcript_product=hypothetical protein / location=Cvel_scaffold341:7564-9993(+) / protein_length=221 / sequence_SO=supercontig / SO=protein_coding / is_pseudo=false